jgi:hypothetical protein
MKRYVYILLAGIVFFRCGSSPTDSGNNGGSGASVDELLNSAWTEFESYRYDNAKSYFDQVLVKEPSNCDASLGKGWSLLLQGSNHYQLAINAFDVAIAEPACEADSRAGIIVAKFNQERYDEIPALVDYFTQKYPKYVFEHDENIDWHDLLLMKAQAQYFIRQYSTSWTTVKKLTTVYDYMDPSASDTWIIEEQIFFSFEAALSKIIYILSETFK